jgi:GT2 family glycosyltransferase
MPTYFENRAPAIIFQSLVEYLQGKHQPHRPTFGSGEFVNDACTAPQLSICIINWNGKAMLRGLLQSIEEHRGEIIVETLVADNASSDGSPDMVAAEFPWVILFRNTENLGAAKGYNQGVDAAKAPLVLLINNDTLIRRGALQTLVKFMNENPDVVAVGPKLIGGDGEPQRTGRNLPTLGALMNYIQLVRWTGLFRGPYKRYRHANFDADKPADYEQLSASAMVVRRDAYQRHPFDVGYRFGIEDVDFCARVRKEDLLSSQRGDCASGPDQFSGQSGIRLSGI